MNEDLINYIKQAKQTGINKEEIVNSLLEKGWNKEEIDQAFYIVSSSSDPTKQTPTENTNVSLPGAIDILRQSLFLFKQRLGVFLGIIIIPVLLLSFLREYKTLLSFFSSNISDSKILFFVLLVILPFVIVYVWGKVALLYAIKDSQEKIGIAESYRRGWSKILSYLWILILSGFITFGGFLLLVVPGVVFAVWFSFALFVLVAENLKGMDALLKSKEYVKGRWSSVFWRILFISAIFLFFAFISGVVLHFFDFPFVEIIINFLISLFLIPLVSIYLFLLYKNLKDLRGEFTFVRSGGKKAGFAFVGVLGFLFLAVAVYMSFLYFGSLVKLNNIFQESDLKQTGSYSFPDNRNDVAPNYNLIDLNDPILKKARDTKRKANIISIQVGLRLYYNDNGEYPSSLDKLSPHYIDYIPTDPITKKPYEYQLLQEGRDYKVCVQFEKEKQECYTSSSFK